MEYLQQGLERFKQEHGSERVSPRPAGGPVPSAPQPIVYRSTRNVEITDEMMRAQRLIAGFEGGAFVDAYKMLRTQVVQQCRQKGWNVLGITSPASHEGKTLTAVNLSLALAMDLAHTVLLVDADMRRPGVHQAFGMESCQGLSEYLFDETPLEQLLVHPGIGRFVFLPGGRRITNSAEALASPRMGALVSELKHRYPDRLLVFDLPPLLSRADVLGFVPRIDALLLVVEEGRTGSVDVERAMTALKGTVPILGGVLNMSGRGEMTRRRAKDLLMAHTE
ncbi:MAG TPA: CpsD/CapB family tyrosine-protein kinase [Nitrospiraceae bacterium]|nr:CpsD/CapB family tyrosine-protein kinase [Nitrospiraceae bacterium]